MTDDAAGLLLRNIRVDGRDGPVDLLLSGGQIEGIAATGTLDVLGQGTSIVDGRGHLALPGLVDGHAHVDKSLWGLPWRPHSAGPGLAGLVANEQDGRRDLPPVVDRVSGLFDAYLDAGTTLIRTHVDVDTDQGLTAIEGVLEAAERFRDTIDIEVVAFPQSGMLVAPGTAALMESAIAAGAHIVGGIDPAGFDGDAVTHIDTIFDIADRHGVGVDLHLHDRGSLGRWEVELVIDRTLALSMQGHVTVSHAFCLCDGDAAVDPLLARLADAGIALATVAPGNVEPLPMARITELGIPVALGQDGIRDLWSPWGDADMLARAGLLSWRAGHRRDEDLAHSVNVATTLGAEALGRPGRSLEVGGVADVVLVDVASAAEAAVVHPARSLVVSGGVVVRSSNTEAPTE